ncbi:hypothetical protein [[Mycoplasma] gypis]|uniref:Uncharacterized protein n=1 Tax=[Mycoplasma] gypis TaxID=92404 RepID=A0ABZ2RN47_9BACT|nr:hypothetical protein [[Mycoplasma] gypis]MBN0919617.1 hypothetical protein [[Mycoplasma] gypis]
MITTKESFEKYLKDFVIRSLEKNIQKYLALAEEMLKKSMMSFFKKYDLIVSQSYWTKTFV